MDYSNLDEFLLYHQQGPHHNPIYPGNTHLYWLRVLEHGSTILLRLGYIWLHEATSTPLQVKIISLVSYGPSRTVYIAFLLTFLSPGVCDFHAF